MILLFAAQTVLQLITSVVVDDWDMGITHVVRSEDHINNAPRQINI